MSEASEWAKVDAESQTVTESDGCPTELAVLKRFWRAHQGARDHAQLMKFYGVETLSDLVDKQAHHIERLQAKLPPTPNVFAPQRVREG